MAPAYLSSAGATEHLARRWSVEPLSLRGDRGGPTLTRTFSTTADVDSVATERARRIQGRRDLDADQSCGRPLRRLCGCEIISAGSARDEAGMATNKPIVPRPTRIGRPHPSATQPILTAAPLRPLPAGYIHLGVAKEIAPTLRAFGLDPDPIIKEAGLDPRLFEDGSNVIPHLALGRLCSLSVARTHCPHLGLVGERATILSLGVVGRLMLHSKTVGEALRGLVAHLGVQNWGAVPALAVNEDTAVFSFAVYQPETESADQICDGALACTVNALRALLGEGWAPSEVLLPRAGPADAEPFRRHFPPVRFDQEIAALVFGPPAGADRRRRSAPAGDAGGAGRVLEGRPFHGRHPAAAPDAACERHVFGGWLGRPARHASAHPEPPPGRRRHALPDRGERSPVRDRPPVAGRYRPVLRPGRGGARLFGGERLHAGLPALVRPDPKRLAGAAPPRRRAGRADGPNRQCHVPGGQARPLRFNSMNHGRPCRARTP